ncbi:ABCC5 [Bugula neritina]|uniref:ABCC5 n=1 Tax=Bugula neritina TaxID=10212 RepID=A0A7J7JCQ1_BUGNE|nr:ABCC5 [Bugula neritina]
MLSIRSYSHMNMMYYIIQMTGIFQYTLRFWLETEAKFTSVERIQGYVNGLASEAPPIIEGRQPNSDWPEEGAITFENVDVRYREGLPLVLKTYH